MTNDSIEKAMRNAAASLEIEGFTVDSQTKTLCRKLLNKEITMDEYINSVKRKAGISA